MDDARPRYPILLARAIILIAVIATFFPVMRHEFGGWDDEQNLTLNPQMHPPTWESVRGYWMRPTHDLYAPVNWTLWSLLARVGYQSAAPSPEAQLNPYLFHTTNLALHVGSALLAFELMRRLFGRDALVASAVGALLFALHPVQVEPVAWVSGLKDVLAGMLSIGAIVLFLNGSRDVKRYIAAVIVFALAMLSKPSAVVVPAIVIAIDVIVRRVALPQSLVRFAPAIALAIIGAIIARLAQQAAHVPHVDWWQRPLVAADAIAFYLSKIVWPQHLGPHYGRTPQYVLSLGRFEWFWLTPLIVIALLAMTRNRFVVTAIVIFLIAIAPVLGIVPFDFQEYSTVADHYLYLAMLGPAAFLAWISSRARRYTIFALIFVVLFAGQSFRQSLEWRDALSISKQAVRANPDSKLWHDRLVRLLLERAGEQADRGETQQAIGTYNSVLAHDPNNAIALANLASVLAASGRVDEAIPLYERALRIDPTLEPARTGLQRARSRR